MNLLEVLVAVLLCVIFFLLYLLNENKNEVLRLKRERRERDIDVAQQPQENFRPQLPPPSEIFASVIFKPGDQRYYDYFVGDNDVKVGDFVEVYFNNKSSGKVERRIAQVIYVSKPGEVSEFARSKIKRKADYPKW